MPTLDNQALLERAIEDWNRGDLEAYMKLYSGDVRLHGLPPGIAAVQAMYEGMWKAFPGSRLVLEDIVSQGEKVACRYTFQATNTKTGQRFRMPGITILHFRGGRCVERWDFEGRTEQGD